VRRVDAVHLPLQLDVHERQVRPRFVSEMNGLLRPDRCTDCITEIFEASAQVLG
jgi:hypothetical protein